MLYRRHRSFPGSRATALFVLSTVSAALAAGLPAAEKRDAGTKKADPLLAAVLQGGVPRTRAELKAMEEHVRSVLEKVRPCTVTLAGGSGVVVSKDGYVLTVAHVSQRAGRTVTMTFPGGRRVRGKTLGSDRGLDAGLVKITDQGEWPYAEMGSSAAQKPGRWCIALSSPGALRRTGSPVVRLGRILRNSARALVTDCTIMGGDSGGPLFDMEGKVIGISSRCDRQVTRNYHVPVDAYLAAWERFLKGEDFDSRGGDRDRRRRPRAFLGVAPSEGTDEAKIGRVIPGSGAAKAGIQAGDVLVSFDGKKLSAYRELPPLLGPKKPGDTVEVTVRRGKNLLTLQVTLGERRS